MDEQQRNEVILKHLKLAFSLATRYRNVDHDDLIDIALFTLTKEVKNFYELDEHDDNVTRYLASRIRFRIIDYLRAKKIEVTLRDWDHFIAKNNQELVLEIRDTIERCCKNELDEFIFDCKLKGMTDTEIAEKIKKAKTTITVARNVLYSRFRVYWGEL